MKFWKNKRYYREKYFPAKKLLRLVALALAALHGILFVNVGALCLLFSLFNPPITSLMVYRKVFYNYHIKPVDYVPVERISSQVKRMVIKVEDYKFYHHHGVDFQALLRAYQVNQRVGYPLYGGSTITMQLARSLFLVPAKSYLRKYIEVLIAIEMDLVLTKERILELYLNYIEWGKGVFGIGSAAHYYFHQPLDRLTTRNYIKLSTILPNPIEYNVTNFYENHIMLERYNFLISRF
ncbi:MAG: transglycosylase domain-containing protein [Spirochaetota bacterium]